MNEALDGLYKDIILEHSKAPRNFGELAQPDAEQEGYNPLCGDRVLVKVKANGAQISEIRFTGEGCSICMASASIMTEEVEGKPSTEALNQIQDFRDLMQGKKETEETDSDLEALFGVRKFPVRIKCALLPWTTLKQVLEKLPSSEVGS